MSIFSASTATTATADANCPYRRISRTALVGSSFGKPSDAGEDLVRGLGPDVGLGIVVVGVDVLLDGVAQLADAAVAPTPQLLIGQIGEVPLDEVDPGAVRGGEVDLARIWLFSSTQNTTACSGGWT